MKSKQEKSLSYLFIKGSMKKSVIFFSFFNENFFLKININWSATETKQISGNFGDFRATLASEKIFWTEKKFHHTISYIKNI